MLLATVAVGADGVFSSDEGAGIIQARSVGEGWSDPHPFPEADPDGAWYPLEKAGRTPDGGFAALPKKPLYSAANALAGEAAGVPGMIALSAIAAVAAASAAAVLARDIDPRLARPTLWLTGLASPLLVDGMLIIGHSVGAALGGWLLVTSMRARQRPTLAALAAVTALAAGAAMVRNEAVLLGASVGVVMFLYGVLTRHRVAVAVAGVAACGTALGFTLDRVWSSRLFGSGAFSGPSLAGSDPRSVGALVSDRWAAFVTSWLRPGYGGSATASALGLVIVALGLYVVWLARRVTVDRPWVRSLAVVLTVVAVARLLVPRASPDVVPGLTVAFPLVLWGVASLDRRTLRHLRVYVPMATFAVFTLAVLATQYRDAGSWEWGGRYFAVGLPALTPVVAAGGLDLRRRLDVLTARFVVSTWVVVSCVLALIGLGAVRDARVLSDRLVDGLMQASAPSRAGDGGLPVIVATEPELPRTGWDRLDEARWMLADVTALPELLDRLDGLGVRELTLATRRSVDAADAVDRSRYSLRWEGAPPETVDWWFVVLERR